jgi:hypothetical protein
MSSAVATAILELAACFEPGGITMWRIVDVLEGRGLRPQLVENELWQMLARRQLTPCGYICRKVRRRDALGEFEQARSYELLLIPWSEDLDRQLELKLAEGDR